MCGGFSFWLEPTGDWLGWVMGIIGVSAPHEGVGVFFLEVACCAGRSTNGCGWQGMTDFCDMVGAA